MKTNPSVKISPTEAQRIALQNLTQKVQILETWVKGGVPWECDEAGTSLRNAEGARINIYTPDSLRSFNSWSHERYSNLLKLKFNYLSLIHRNGTDTLNKYPQLKNQVLNLLKGLAKVLMKQNEEELPTRAYKLEIEALNLSIFIENQALKITELQRRNLELARKLNSVELLEAGKFTELLNNYKILETQYAHATEQNSLLVRQLSNIHLLKDAKRGK